MNELPEDTSTGNVQRAACCPSGWTLGSIAYTSYIPGLLPSSSLFVTRRVGKKRSGQGYMGVSTKFPKQKIGTK